MQEVTKRIAVWQNKRMLMVVVAFLTLSGVALASKIPMFTAWIGDADKGPELTIIARVDGTFDIKEYTEQNQWFKPDVVGEGLAITAKHRFGRSVNPDNVSVMVLADPGVKDEAIRTALISAAHHGFHRIGFTDPRLGDIARKIASTPFPDPPLENAPRSTTTRRRK